MDDDPGWALTWKSIPLMLVPALLIRRTANADPLVGLRSIFVAFCTGIVAIGVVVVILGDMTDGQERTGLSVAVVVAAGCATLLARRFVVRQLDCTSEETLASSYRTRFFVRLGFSEAAALVGFVAAIVLGPWWVYFIGACFTAVGFSQLAPTRRHLAQDQSVLSKGGCLRSLVAALRSPVVVAASRAR